MTNPSLHQARALLRQSRGAVLASDDRVDACRYILDGETGRPVASVPAAALQADEHVLFIPDETPGALQLLTIPEPIDAHDRCCDQWQAYFGQPTGGVFIRFVIDCARLGPTVIDGDELAIRNDLLGDVAALCGHFNRQPGAIEKLCAASGCQSPSAATLVGVDGYGIDVRTKFSVLRFEFSSRAGDREDAGARIELMIKDAKGSG